MTPDSLEAAQRAVPMSCGILPGGNHSGHHACWPDYPALAAAAQAWMRQQLVDPNVLALALCLGDPDTCRLGDTPSIPRQGHQNTANYVMADVELWLGLSKPIHPHIKGE